jgi:signal transduction histidine kinase
VSAHPPVLAPKVVEIDVFVALLSELDTAAPPLDFYSRLCEAVLRLTSMERAGLFLYEPNRHTVGAVGCAGVDPAILRDVRGTLAETPLAQRALREDRVVEVSDDLERYVPARYAKFAGITTLTCTPVAAGGRRLGVLFADRGGGRFTLADSERDALWTLGKLAALIETARIAAQDHERATVLADRIHLAREIHDGVVQRLFGVSLALDSERPLEGESRKRASEELNTALKDLRSALQRPLAPQPTTTYTTLRAELDRVSREEPDLPLRVRWAPGVEVPVALEPLVQSVVAEAFRNVRRHADPTWVEVLVSSEDGDTIALEVINDGARPEARGLGMGLRLVGLEALRYGGVIEHGPLGPGRWHVRIALPMEGVE